MPKLSIGKVDVKGKRVLMRADFNVPIDDYGNISDDRRIRLALPSIKSVIDHGGKLVLMSHLGRPEGKGYEPTESMKPAADRLRELLKTTKVTLAGNDPVGSDAAEAVKNMRDGEVVVLENLRFHKGEKKGDAEFAATLASFGDIYCNEAFGTAHRSDASMVAVPKAMMNKPRAAGLLLQKEIKYLSETIENARPPFIAVLGGAKVSDKLGALRNLANRVDGIVVGGAMAYTFLKAMGVNVGNSRVEGDMLDEAKSIIRLLDKAHKPLHLPVDHVCAADISATASMSVHRPGIPDGLMGLDIGPETSTVFAEYIHEAKTIAWNGPMGVFETPPFDVGTRHVAEAVARATKNGATSVVGGGDTAAAVEHFGLADEVSHVSTGGGASLQMLEGVPFESISMLSDAVKESASGRKAGAGSVS